MNNFACHHIGRVFFVKEKIGHTRKTGVFRPQLRCKARILLTAIFRYLYTHCEFNMVNNE